ncbi:MULTISPECIES: hypothetical protein [unclassified Streptomyces]|uniref:Uncharacterized protein n=1 Tax=Streptomyces sp. NBC_00060 TaxID=2975636 RepID=A0AAU2HDJ2_9ACTN
MTVQQWPEGPGADQDAARERYKSDMRTTRTALREVFRADMPAAHGGVAVVVVAGVVVGCFAGPVAGGLVAAGFAVLFFVAVAVMYLRGIRGADAWRRSYLCTFGWGNWI